MSGNPSQHSTVYVYPCYPQLLSCFNPVYTSNYVYNLLIHSHFSYMPCYATHCHTLDRLLAPYTVHAHCPLPNAHNWRPHRLFTPDYVYGCCRRQVDAIQHYSREESRLSRQVEIEKAAALNQPLGIAFITFRSREVGEPTGSACLTRTGWFVRAGWVCLFMFCYSCLS